MKTTNDPENNDDGTMIELRSSHPGESTLVNLNVSGQQLERGLKSRHIQFLALGGAIGTGLFIGSGSILARAGPASLFIGYLVMIFVVWVIMNDLAELATYLPLKGISVPYFVNRFLDPSLAFAAGWNYWYAYAILIGAEATAAGIVIQYWETPVHVAVWIAIVLAVNLALNIATVKYFGEAEFWFASIKVITICGLMILGVVIFFGGGPNQDRIPGFAYWQEPGAFVEYTTGGATGRFLGTWSAICSSAFAFIFSPELIAIAAGETQAPRRNIPKAARRFIWRLATFYGGCSLIIGILVPSNSARLLGASSDASASPFVIGIQMVGIPALNHIINAAILTSAWSAGNSFLYSGSRVLYSLAMNGSAPKIFRITNKAGVPWPAVLATWSIGLLGFLNASNSSAEVFDWLVNIVVICGFIAWIVVCITYLRFRRAMEFRGALDKLPYKTPLQPYATWFAVALISILMITNGFHVFVGGYWSVSGFFTAYVSIPVFLVFYVGHKVWKRGPLYIPIDQIDTETGREEMEEMAANDVAPKPKGFMQRLWFWIA